MEDPVAKLLKNYTIVSQDLSRPWGRFYCIDSKEVSRFMENYFGGLDLELDPNIFWSPKILVINPGKRLSWQYHLRRKEIWTVLQGPVGVMTSRTDESTPLKVYQTGDIITIDVEERHRLIGLKSTAIVGELWWHTDPNNLSDEADIIRLEDDYNRK